MKFNKDEQEIFESLIDDFCKEYGREALKGIYKLAKQFRQELGVRQFPTSSIYHHLLYQDLKTKYSTIPLKKIASIEKIPNRTIYYFFNNYVKKRRSQESSLSKLQKPSKDNI